MAALVGAVAAVVVLWLSVNALYRGPTHDNWDLATFPLLVLASVPVLVVGAIGAYRLSGFLQVGDGRSALLALLAVVSLVEGAALCVVRPDVLFPAQPFRPRSPRDRRTTHESGPGFSARS